MYATFELVADRVSITSGAPVESLRPDTTLRDLALDSFLMVELAVDLQEEFDAIFTQEDLRRVVTIADLVDLLNAARVEPAQATSDRPAVPAPTPSASMGGTHG